MKPERWQQVDQLFQAALKRAPGEQTAFLAQACAGDEALRREVELLMAADKQAVSFIEAPAYQLAAPRCAQAGVAGFATRNRRRTRRRRIHSPR